MAPPTMPMGMNNSLASAPQKQTSELAKILGNKEMSQLEKMSRLHSNNTVPYSGANPTSSPMAQMIGSPNQMHHPNASMSPTSGIPMTRPNGQGKREYDYSVSCSIFQIIFELVLKLFQA